MHGCLDFMPSLLLGASTSALVCHGLAPGGILTVGLIKEAVVIPLEPA
jgi:hypothetical protein